MPADRFTYGCGRGLTVCWWPDCRAERVLVRSSLPAASDTRTRNRDSSSLLGTIGRAGKGVWACYGNRPVLSEWYGVLL